MDDPLKLVTAVAFGGVVGAFFIVMAGLRRIPWHDAAILGLGYAIVFAAIWIATVDRLSPMLVIVGAIGGGVIQRSFDRGERERRRISADILSRSSAPPA